MEEYKWVRSDMDLYKINKDSKNIISVKNSGSLDIDFYEYAKNFYEAAERVLHYILIRKSIYELDIWYFAIVYLYRHSLELMLKACVFQVITETFDRKKILKQIQHNLLKSFDKLIEIKGLTIDDNKNAKWLQLFLKNISDIDSKSDIFRYPFGKNLKTFVEKQTNISLVATHNNMNKAFSILKGIFDTGNISNNFFECDEPKLIIECEDYYHQSVVGYEYSKNKFFPYYSSYEEVGEFLKDIIITEKKNNFFMPMCYMYRNAIELGLKRIIIEDSKIDYDSALELIHSHKHNILDLWKIIEGELRGYDDSPSADETLKNSLEYIKKINDADPKSDLFRFPCDKSLKSKFVKSKQMDVDNVTSCFKEICNVLDAVDTMLDYYKGIEAEIRAEYEDCY